MVWGAMRHGAHSAPRLSPGNPRGVDLPLPLQRAPPCSRTISPYSAEGRLVECSELAAVQPRPFAPQLVACLNADPHMLADGALVEAIGLAGELQFAVERLVRDAEQRAIGDAEAIALAGDGR